MNNDVIYIFDITDGPSKDRIFDAFKYAREEISLEFRLRESKERPLVGLSGIGAQPHTGEAVANRSFGINSIEYIKNESYRYNTIRVKGDCDLYYLDVDGHTDYDNKWIKELGTFHVDFDLDYSTETHKGVMFCSNVRDAYYDPWDY